ncbi:MAG: AAA family ATPase [Candidatus Lokiarchaeota archaeon]
MILKSLKINNIRSIADLVIEFPKSTILFYGDIGSGKSSVLKSIEFALFGTLRSSELSGESLLRRGKSKGYSELTFSLDGDEYTIYRELNKVVRNGDDVIRQPEGWLKKNGTKTSYTTTELRKEILRILNYSISRYERKESIDIFRYTVYTPQEQIKEILQADPNERFEILKDVLEIEKYETAFNNINLIRKSLNRKLRNIRRDIKNIGSPEEEIPKKESEIEEKEGEILTKKSEIEAQRTRLKEEKQDLKKTQEDLNQCSQKLNNLEDKERQISKDKKELNKTEIEITKLSSEIEIKEANLEKIPQVVKTSGRSEAETNDKIKKYRKNLSELISKKGSYTNQINKIEDLLEKNKCSLCGQEIHEKERFNNELKDFKGNLENLLKKIKEINEKIQKLEKFKELLVKYQKEKELIKVRKEHKESLKSKIDMLRTSISDNQKEIQNILDTYKIKDLDELKSLRNSLKVKESEQEKNVNQEQSELTKLEKLLSTIQTELRNLKEKLIELKQSLKQKNQLEQLIEYVSSVNDWVTEQFSQLIKDIERSILAATAVNFNHYFKNWFKALVEEENIEIEIDPANFQPIIRVNGYDSPFEDCSGGEKSALSLAYRLALNKVITVKHPEVKTKNLLILDEPTDGFSQQQVNKMQEIFDKINTEQMIIISHERSLDSFVTDIFNFKKENHKTKVVKEERTSL